MVLGLKSVCVGHEGTADGDRNADKQASRPAVPFASGGLTLSTPGGSEVYPALFS
jgi:hypothetical protein